MTACGSGASGELVLLLDPDEATLNGITAGIGPGQIRDGWSVHFDKFIVGVGDVEIARNESDAALLHPVVHIVDLAKLPATGMELTRFRDVEAVRWHNVSYRTPAIFDEAVRDASVTEDDFFTMGALEWTHLLEGRIEKPGGESCPPEQGCRPADTIRFRLGVSAPSRFSFCASPLGVTGVAVPVGAPTQAALSLHGDHIFFNAFLTGHTNLELRAQWLADSDVDGNGLVTDEELATVSAADVMPLGSYSFAGSPKPVITAHDFVVGQLATLGHFQGEGECAWTLESACTEEKHHSPGACE